MVNDKGRFVLVISKRLLLSSYVLFYLLSLIQRSPVSFVPDQDNNKAGQCTAKVSKMGYVISGYFAKPAKKV